MHFFRKLFSGRYPSIPEQVAVRYMDIVETFVENEKEDEFDDEEEIRDNKFKNRNKAKQHFYYILYYLTDKILKSKCTLDELINPQTLKQYVISRTYFNNLIEAFEIVDPKSKEYNLCAYEYIINNEELDEPLRIIENFNEPSYQIVTIDGKHFPEYLKDNKIGVTISGTLFKTHEEKLSIFYTFLNELYSLRNQYKKKMFQYPKGSFERAEFNRRQLTTKILMNSTYGLLGMKTFRYSNKHLAQTITVSGRLALKTAQFFAEKYIDAKFEYS